MRWLIKSTLCNISYLLNLPVYLGPFGKDKIIVLMYHGVINSYLQDPLKNICGYNISVKQFEKQMRYLSENCNVITASESIEGKNISSRKKNVVITFDDAYRNIYTNAFPVLLKYKLPALFSIPTEFVVNKKPLWNDVIEYAVATTKKKSVHIKWNDICFNFKFDTTTKREEFIRWLIDKSTEILQENREQFIGKVLQELDVSIDSAKMLKDPDYEPLMPDDIRIMTESKLVGFASHSIHHYALSLVNKDTLIDELKGSKSDVEHMTGLPCKYLCIPGGHYSNHVIDAALDAGFKKIFSSEPVEFSPNTVPYVIGRHCIYRTINMPLFADIIHGPFHRMSSLLKS